MPRYRPGDHILNRYVPNASPEEREEARESLEQLAQLFIRAFEP
jgi:hypothetical protein